MNEFISVLKIFKSYLILLLLVAKFTLIFYHFKVLNVHMYYKHANICSKLTTFSATQEFEGTYQVN